jgi:hypothetical protein
VITVTFEIVIVATGRIAGKETHRLLWNMSSILTKFNLVQSSSLRHNIPFKINSVISSHLSMSLQNCISILSDKTVLCIYNFFRACYMSPLYNPIRPDHRNTRCKIHIVKNSSFHPYSCYFISLVSKYFPQENVRFESTNLEIAYSKSPYIFQFLLLKVYRF